MHGQHISLWFSVWLARRDSWATSTSDMKSELASDVSWARDAISIAACAFWNWWHEQQLCFWPHCGVGLLLHCRLHLGRLQLAGLRQDHVHLGAEHVGLHLGVAGVHTVWHLAGRHTFSHSGQPPDWQFLREQRTSHLGFSQRMSHCVSGSFSQRSSHEGFSHCGSHTAGHDGWSQFHLQSGKQLPLASKSAVGEKGSRRQ